MLEEKVVVITGGAGLLGRHFCNAVADNGGIVIVADFNINAATEVVNGIMLKGGKAEAIGMDITNKESVIAAIDYLDKKYGHIDAVVNNAYPRNKNYGQKLELVSYEDFIENCGMHMGGYFLVAQQFANYFKNTDGGNIINMASIYGVMNPQFDVYNGTTMTMPVEYAAIKAGIIHMNNYFAQYYKKEGVRCNCISPGGIFDHQPEKFLEQYNQRGGKKGMLSPADITGTLIYLLSDQSRYVTGQNIIIDDGFSL